VPISGQSEGHIWTIASLQKDRSQPKLCCASALTKLKQRIVRMRNSRRNVRNCAINMRVEDKRFLVQPAELDSGIVTDVLYVQRW